MALLEASGIGKNFGETKVLKDISLTLEQGEALAIIGSSRSRNLYMKLEINRVHSCCYGVPAYVGCQVKEYVMACNHTYRDYTKMTVEELSLIHI